MFASTHFFSALSVPPAVVFSAVSVVREIDWPSTRMSEVACTSVVPVVAEVIVTVQLAEVVEAPTRVVTGVGLPTKLPGPPTLLAVA